MLTVVKRITFTPLGQEEMPKKGDLIAIDAEFVTLNLQEGELRSDRPSVSTVKAAHMSVARITCVRVEGMMEGAHFTDDFILTQERRWWITSPSFPASSPGISQHLILLLQKLRFLVYLSRPEK